MKSNFKKMLPAALLGATAVAHAQSSVTLYGMIDDSIQYVHNTVGASGQQGSKIGLYAGNLSGDRFGLRGVEELGGGLDAIFQIENGFNVNNGTLGQGGRMFGRQAWVGLSSDSFGKLTLGRQYDPNIDLVQPAIGLYTWGSPFAVPGDVDNSDNGSRVNNAIKYATPSIAGLVFEGMYGLGGASGQTGSAQTWGVAGQYTRGGLIAAAGYLRADNSASEAPRASSTTPWSGTIDGNFASTINSGAKTAKAYSVFSTAIGYTFGSATIRIHYSNAEYIPDAASSFRNTEIFNTIAGYLDYRLTPMFLVGAQYNYTRASGSARASYNQFSLGADYNLSKRTDFYLIGVYQHMNGNQLGDAGGATAGDYGYASAPGTHSQEIVSLGIRHKF
ncbi:porin [Paraburkholderia fungorum]